MTDTPTAPTGKRQAWAAITGQQDENGFVACLVTEDDPQFEVAKGNGAHAVPWYLGKTIEEANATAEEWNAQLFNLTPDQAQAIRDSSIIASIAQMPDDDEVTPWTDEDGHAWDADGYDQSTGDPEPNNGERARRALAGLSAYAEQSGQTGNVEAAFADDDSSAHDRQQCADEVIVDLMSNLLHLGASVGLEPEMLLRRADLHFCQENRPVEHEDASG